MGALAQVHMNTLKVGLLGLYPGYTESFVCRLLQHLSPKKIEWVDSIYCDLLIVGPFDMKKVGRAGKRYQFWDRHPALQRLTSHQRPRVLMHLSENVRPDFFPADDIITSDFCPPDGRQIRFPYWMEMLDWTTEGVDVGARNPRYGRLLSIDRLMQPLGEAFMSKPRCAAIFSSHLREPRKRLIDAVARQMPVEGFGAAFDQRVRDHNTSGFTKFDILKNYGFNLCPENSLFPGYYTEKIPEAFHADCLPISWADRWVSVDFNPHAFINLAQEGTVDDHGLPQPPVLDTARLREIAQHSLLQKRPSLAPIITLLTRVVGEL